MKIERVYISCVIFQQYYYYYSVQYSSCNLTIALILFNILCCSIFYSVLVFQQRKATIFLSKCILCHLYVSAISVTFMIWIFTFPSYLDAIIITITLVLSYRVLYYPILSCLALPCYIFHFFFSFIYFFIVLRFLSSVIHMLHSYGLHRFFCGLM